MATTIDADKVCLDCLTVKPMGDFRRRSKHDETRLNQCRQCHNRAERHRRALQRRDGRDRRITSFVTHVKNETNLKRIEALCQVMIAEFGGLDGFIAAWIDQVRRAREQNPGSKKILDFFQAIVRLTQCCEAHQPQLPAMTDEDLDREVANGVADLIRNQPKLAIQAAATLGWTLVPPNHANTPG